MIDFGFALPKRKHIDDLNIVPILDMFVAIIFFLLLTTSFIGLTKLQVPPSQVSTNTDPVVPPPLGTQFFLTRSKGNVVLTLQWQGARPGSTVDRIALNELNNNEILLVRRVAEQMKAFSQQYPAEKTVQMALQADLPYQILISAMDGVREYLPDVVLLSPDDVALAKGGE